MFKTKFGNQLMV